MTVDVGYPLPGRDALPNKAGRRGMTLIEVILACGILTVVMLCTLLVVMAIVRNNRLVATEISASNAIRTQMEEVMSAARDNIGHNDVANLAEAVIYYYGTNFTDPGKNAIRIGPDNSVLARTEISADRTCLIYRFGVPDPGQPARDASAANAAPKYSMYGVGTMTIYLDERTVVPAETVDPSWQIMWRDLGVAKAATTMKTGFDMNRDGLTDNKKSDGAARPPVTQNVLRNPGELDIKQLPIDISVTYYSRPDHRNPVYQITRRMIVM